VARGRPLGRVSSLHLRPRAAGAPLAVARSLHDALPISRMDLRMFRQKQHVVEGQALADDPWAAIRIDHCSSRPWMREARGRLARSEEHTAELQSRENVVCRPLLGTKNEPSAGGPRPAAR